MFTYALHTERGVVVGTSNASEAYAMIDAYRKARDLAAGKVVKPSTQKVA